MRALLAAGANPRAKFRSTTGTGRADITPLLLATKLNTTEMAKLLLGVTDGGGEEVKVTEKVDVGNTGEEKTTSKPTIASEGFQT
jgi:hypothetical protein